MLKVCRTLLLRVHQRILLKLTCTDLGLFEFDSLYVKVDNDSKERRLMLNPMIKLAAPITAKLPDL